MVTIIMAAEETSHARSGSVRISPSQRCHAATRAVIPAAIGSRAVEVRARSFAKTPRPRPVVNSGARKALLVEPERLAWAISDAMLSAYRFVLLFTVLAAM